MHTALSSSADTVSPRVNSSPSTVMAWRKVSFSLRHFIAVFLPWPRNWLVESHPENECIPGRPRHATGPRERDMDVTLMQRHALSSCTLNMSGMGYTEQTYTARVRTSVSVERSSMWLSLAMLACLAWRSIRVSASSWVHSRSGWTTHWTDLCAMDVMQWHSEPAVI